MSGINKLICGASTTNQMIETVNACVDGSKALDGIKALEAIEGVTLNVTGFYAGSTVGGGVFIWDAAKDKAEHNGGTVIAPEAIAAWDGTSGDISTLLDWSGTGAGCFVRVVGSELSVFDFGASIDGESTSNAAAINKAINSGHSIDGASIELSIGSPIIVNGNAVFSNLKLKVDTSSASNFVILTINGSNTKCSNIALDGSRDQRDALIGFDWVSGFLVIDGANNSGVDISVSNVGKSSAGSLTGQFAFQIERSLSSMVNVRNNNYRNLTLSDNSYLCPFGVRIVTDFQGAGGLQGYDCSLNSITNVNSDGFYFNVCEIAGPDTHSNIISNFTACEVDSPDVFDFDHGCSNNIYEKCRVISIRGSAQSTQINILSNKETVAGAQALNRSRDNSFIDCGITGVNVQPGLTVRVATDLYGLNTKYIRPYITNVDDSDVDGSLIFVASLTADNTPTQIDNLLIQDMRVSYCDWLLHFSGAGGDGYKYNSINIDGGHAECVRFNETSEISSLFSGCSINGLAIKILGSGSSDALRMPIASDCSLLNCIVDGSSSTDVIYNIGGTSGVRNKVSQNTFISPAASTGRAGVVSQDIDTIHDSNAYINRYALNNYPKRYGDDAEMLIYEGNLINSPQSIGSQFFNTEKRYLGLWQGSNSLKFNARVTGATSTKDFYAGVLGVGDVGFTMFLTDNNQWITWDGSAFRDPTGTLI